MPHLVKPEEYGDEPAVPHQRVGAYGVLTRDERILLTRIAQKDYGAGMWTLPGGGLDHGEDPSDAVVREVLEETGLRVRPLRVRFVHSAHFYGRNRAGVLEDFHGLHVLYDVEALPGQDLDRLEIIEEDSSTDLVAWLGVRDLWDGTTFDRPFTSLTQALLLDLLGVPHGVIQGPGGTPDPVR